jgi:hypothetical protein
MDTSTSAAPMGTNCVLTNPGVSEGKNRSPENLPGLYLQFLKRNDLDMV